MTLRILLLSLLPGLLVTQTFAATINLSPGANVITAVAAAHPGDVVVFGAGTFNLSSPVQVPNGVTLTGVSPNSSHIVFNLPGGAFGSYAFVLGYTLSNVTIENLDLISNKGLIQMSNGAGYTNTTISYNNLKYGTGTLPDGTAVFGISSTVPNKNLQITHNYFHDSTAAGSRNWCIWYASNSNLDYNLFYNIIDGGQICDCGPNVSFSHNYGTNMNRMGQEAGLDSQSNLTINGNVFYNWISSYPDSDALSIIGVSGQINYTNNFFQASMAPGSSWGPADGGGLHRFGIAIEGTGQPAIVTGNTFVGTWACDYSSTIVNAQVYDNTVWGQALWGDFDGEPGPNGYGSVNAYSNATYSSSAGAPAPPVNTWAGPNFGGSAAPASPAPKAVTTSGGSLNGSQSNASSDFNLTALGTTDWAHWGRGGNAGNFDHKASGNSQISNVIAVGSGSYGGYYDSSRDCYWSDGTPTSSDGGDDGYLWANNNVGAGYSFTVPASTTTHTVYIYAGGYSSGSTLTAHLSDGSATDYVVSSSGSAHYSNVIAISFHAASAGQKLTLTYVKSQNINGSGGSSDLMAAWLQ